MNTVANRQAGASLLNITAKVNHFLQPGINAHCSDSVAHSLRISHYSVHYQKAAHYALKMNSRDLRIFFVLQTTPQYVSAKETQINFCGCTEAAIRLLQ